MSDRLSSLRLFLVMAVIACWVVPGLGATGAASPSDDVVGRCSERTKRWIATCSAASGLALRPQVCLPDRLVVEADLGADRTLDVDITPDNPSAPVHAGGAGFAPAGSFDWRSESAARRGALAALARCAERDPSLLASAEEDARTSPSSRSRLADAWPLLSGGSLLRMLGGLIAIIVLRLLLRSKILSR